VPVGSQWTFAYPAGSGHVTIVKNSDNEWVSLYRTYSDDIAGVAVIHRRPQVDVPRTRSEPSHGVR
jgi:hypothetical protein